MASMAFSALCSVLLTLVVFVAVMAFFGTTVKERVMARYSLVDCAPAVPSSSTNSSAFRDNLLPLLGALPSAAAPTGFASLRSGAGAGRDHDRAFARGLCFGDSTAPSECLACLSTAAKNITRCDAASRRAGVWSEGCFLAYADTDSSSAGEDAFRRVFSVSGHGAVPRRSFDPRNLVALAQLVAPRAANSSGARVTTDTATLASKSNATGKSTVDVVAQCARDRTAADCARCLRDSARAVPTCCWGLDGTGLDMAAVIGYNCFLLIEISMPPLSMAKWLGNKMKDKPLFVILCTVIPVILVGTALGALIVCVSGCPKRKVRSTGNAAASGQGGDAVGEDKGVTSTCRH